MKIHSHEVLGLTLRDRPRQNVENGHRDSVGGPGLLHVLSEIGEVFLFLTVCNAVGDGRWHRADILFSTVEDKRWESMA
jgi:hypothetical protein